MFEPLGYHQGEHTVADAVHAAYCDHAQQTRDGLRAVIADLTYFENKRLAVRAYRYARRTLVCHISFSVTLWVVYTAMQDQYGERWITLWQGGNTPCLH